MRSAKVSFDIRGKEDTPPPRYHFIKFNLIFDVKMEDLGCRASMVAGGHITDVPQTITYASVVSRETTSVALTMVALNNMRAKTAGIMNDYIRVTCGEEIYTIL